MLVSVDWRGWSRASDAACLTEVFFCLSFQEGAEECRDLMIGGWDEGDGDGDGEAGGGEGCAPGGRHQEQSEGDRGSSLAVMEADVLWSNGSSVFVCV